MDGVAASLASMLSDQLGTAFVSHGDVVRDREGLLASLDLLADRRLEDLELVTTRQRSGSHDGEPGCVREPGHQRDRHRVPLTCGQSVPTDLVGRGA
jgi:hypothetical protein